MENDILNSDILRLRLIDLEYKGLKNEDFEKEIRRIYFEETGHELKADIEILKSSDAKSIKGDESGYDGTAVYFKTEGKDNDQLYILSQGSQQAKDWEYNMNAMLAGQDASQTYATYNFVKDAKEHFNVNDTANQTDIIGMSHSLAHNNNASTQLIYNVFDRVYSVNGAQTNYYQLYSANAEFRQEVNKQFSLNRNDYLAIYKLDPAQLRNFTEEYYEKKGNTKGIYQLISTDDPLYGISGARGFFPVGTVEMIDTNTERPGIRDIFDQLPDSEVAHLQQLAITYTVAEKAGSANGLKELTGLDISIFEGAKGNWDYAKLYMTKGDEINAMIADMNTKVPPLIDSIKKMTSNSDVIFSHFVDAGYLSEADKDIVVKELTNIEGLLEEMKSLIQTNNSIRESQYDGNYSGSNPFMTVLGADIGSLIRLLNLKDSFTESFEKLQHILGPMLAEIGDSHSILEMLNALGLQSGRAYSGSDLILVKGSGADKIKVNISAAVRMYQQGNESLEVKNRHVEALIAALDAELVDGFMLERTKVVSRINEIESNPSSYADHINACVAPSGNKAEVVGANVHEYLPPLSGIQFDGIQSILQTEITNAKTFLTTSRTAIETLFDKDEFVAALFDYVPGG
ncbi:DUF6792 domain-containing protein [Psychrobacillus lasiicapitis]|uniref:DUF6792 domain-containing protein n=1 Tax=Psychrobacillus lasiicapitis TaxID=1636719 RepID=A0A544T1T6_9BACI|nr:DUF6792 domain-containing protein [Psychrobacillus lasiicapitis]TQR11398.1 hypothetical protein FG382_15750 [Psychrobacillus lasiicapitis]GGA40881.1 hypothetical protein GCM10011384_33180 [Psychrobacillus lasiicapitis]